MNEQWIHAILGGALIGISVSLMLVWNGRVTGISNITYGLVNPVKGEISWRLAFLLGLLGGGLILDQLSPEVFSGALETSDWTVGVAGVLVGFGTVLGSGCTSGHGVCGISRLSPRSLVATLLFVSVGALSVFVLKKIGILP